MKLKREDTTPIGVDHSMAFSRVARHAQPWAMGRNPGGILRVKDYARHEVVTPLEFRRLSSCSGSLRR